MRNDGFFDILQEPNDVDKTRPTDGQVLAWSSADNLWVPTNQSGSGGGGTTTNNFNTLYTDQSGGTADTYGVLAGSVNSSNTVFTVSQALYATGTLTVYLNGQLQTQGTAEDWVETSPSAGTFTFATAPTTGDLITVAYAKSVVSASSLLYTRTFRSKTANYTLLTTDLGVECNASGGSFTILLPAASTMTGLDYVIIKTDSSANTVTVDANASELIDGALTKVINYQYSTMQIISNGTGWYII